MELEVFEIFEQFSQKKTRKEKVQFLKDNGVPAVRDVLRGAYDESIEWNLPAGKPPYTPNRPESVPSSLRLKHRDFGFFVKGFKKSEGIATYKRENMFIQLLESIHADDALIVLNMVEKKPPYKGLTKKIVEEAFPNLLP
jgi:hypothetical protein